MLALSHKIQDEYNSDQGHKNKSKHDRFSDIETSSSTVIVSITLCSC